MIVDGDRLLGRITLSNIERGPFQSCNLGYWVSATENGRGMAISRVRPSRSCRLHRIEAGTLLHNKASQKVLERNGFTRFGTAPKYIKIAGRWQDHAMFQLLSPHPDEVPRQGPSGEARQ